MCLLKKYFAEMKSLVYLQPFNGELSSVGLEHLPYKQRVAGSNPAVPTLTISHIQVSLRRDFFCLKTIYVHNKC